MALPVITAAYVLPVGAALATGRVDLGAFATGGLPDIARVVGGAGLAWAIALGAVVSTAGLFLSLTLTNSRLPYVLGRQGALPAAFASVHPRFGTPWVAVLVSAAFYAACATFTFRELIRSEEHTSELQSRLHLVCRLLLEKKKSHCTPYRSTR